LREEVVRDEAEAHASMRLDASLDGIAQVEHDEGKRRAFRACAPTTEAAQPGTSRDATRREHASRVMRDDPHF
jgi:hypothetical protein